jgi:hypothetical protein
LSERPELRTKENRIKRKETREHRNKKGTGGLFPGKKGDFG